MADRLFKKVDYDLGTLVNFIELGQIGLPEIQRPFVWKDTKVRDLFDSMYKGFPVGYLLFWQNGFSDDNKQIGTDQKQKPANLLIVDGQQRLTSLYAILKGEPVIKDNYQKEMIEIAFNPMTEEFVVCDATTKKDKTFIPNISVVWDKQTDIFELVDEYIKINNEDDKLDSDMIKKIRQSVSNLAGLKNFPFTALELSPSISEEQVAEIFVRINSKGTPLNQSDFILTLMSVFWDEGRMELENFCGKSKTPTDDPVSPYNLISQPDPSQILRVSVGLGFKRARLQYVYSILRGKDLETEEFSDERRVKQFEILKEAQTRALDVTYWHDFLKAIRLSGFRDAKYISSQTNLMFAYTLYLIGRTEYKVEEFELRNVIARWFFMSSLTGRYTGSPESAMEFDLARFRNVKTADDFVAELNEICSGIFTDDYWSVNLPNDLATSSARSPSLFAYYASLVILDADVLFSKNKVVDLIDSSIKSKRSSLERHHLFPKAYLQSIGIIETREVNQIANYTVVDWNDNVSIADTSPEKYLPHLIDRFSPEEIRQMYYWHALPDNWEEMDYADFLVRRRERMAKIIRDAFHKLTVNKETNGQIGLPVKTIIETGETDLVEFKSTLRVNLYTDKPDSKIEMEVLKTIAGFLNSKGGVLVIGLADDGSVVGLKKDQFSNNDKLLLHLVNLLNERVGHQWSIYVQPRFDKHEGEDVLIVECVQSRSPVYVKDGALAHFFVRSANSTTELQGDKIQDYIRVRFRS